MSDGGSNAQLRSFIERAERLDEEIAGLNSDKKDLFAEAKSVGFDVAAIKGVLSIRRKDPAKRAAHNEMVALYLANLGMVDAATEVESHSLAHPHASNERANDTAIDWPIRISRSTNLEA